jgi:hypothetical protein
MVTPTDVGRITPVPALVLLQGLNEAKICAFFSSFPILYISEVLHYIRGGKTHVRSI